MIIVQFENNFETMKKNKFKNLEDFKVKGIFDQ